MPNTDPIKKRVANKRWRDRHPDRVYASIRRWRDQNKDKVKEQKRRTQSLERRTEMKPTARQVEIANLYLQMGIKQICRTLGITDKAATKTLKAACRNDEELRRAIFAESARRRDRFVSAEQTVAEIAMAAVEREALETRLVNIEQERLAFDEKMTKVQVERAYIAARHKQFEADAAALQARHAMLVDWIDTLQATQAAPGHAPVGTTGRRAAVDAEAHRPVDPGQRSSVTVQYGSLTAS